MLGLKAGLYGCRKRNSRITAEAAQATAEAAKPAAEVALTTTEAAKAQAEMAIAAAESAKVQAPGRAQHTLSKAGQDHSCGSSGGSRVW